MRDALQQCLDLLESMVAHVSHGGPTRADGERLLGKVKGALQFDDVVGAIERGLAYERAIDLIEGNCREMETDDLILTYYDLEESDDEGSTSEAAMYLDSRRLLDRHPEHHMWVAILDEGEPLPEVDHAA